EDYAEEKEMEPRSVRIRETTLVLLSRSLRARRHRERVVDFEDVLNRDGGLNSKSNYCSNGSDVSAGGTPFGTSFELEDHLRDGYQYGNPPRKDPHPSRYDLLRNCGKVQTWLNQNPRSPSLQKLSRQGRDRGTRFLKSYLKSEDYAEEREMEPRSVRIRETTLVLLSRSLRARRQRERVVDFEDVLNRDGGRVKRNSRGGRPSRLGENNNRSQRMNLPPLLAANYVVV
nr:hypothetical protein [Tanacetum cinerariifolium]